MAPTCTRFIDEHARHHPEAARRHGRHRDLPRAADDPNRNVIVETLTDMAARTIMAQRFIPEIAQGDKRMLVIGGKPFAHCLARIPQGRRDARQPRGRRHRRGATALAARPRDRRGASGPGSPSAGICSSGLDVIGDCLTEVNVTSPTCIVEIAEQTGLNAARDLMDALGA